MLLRTVALSVIMLMGACGDNDKTITYREAHEEWVRSICTHGIKCGTTTHASVDACVAHVLAPPDYYCLQGELCDCRLSQEREERMFECLATFEADCSAIDDCAYYIER